MRMQRKGRNKDFPKLRNENLNIEIKKPIFAP
jgi:hypothetical protein